MSDFSLYQLTLSAGGVVFAAAACFVLCAAPETLAKLEPWPRARKTGFVFGLAALLWCVPLVRPIAFDWLQPLLLPAAIVLPFVCYFYLDYLFARALAGLMMLFAGYLVENSFTFHSGGAPVIAVFSWLFGIGGILISAKPCYLRDYFRLLAAKKSVRRISALFLVLFGAVLWFAFFRHVGVGGRV